jgi:Domain of unknown function (DUF4365)
MPLTPDRPPSHRIGDVGQTAVALCFKRWGWTADLIHSDYGEDLDCTIFTNGRRTTLYFRCQVKSSTDSDQKVRRLKRGDFSISIKSSTAQSWLLSYFPILITLYDEKADDVYWVNASRQIRENINSLSQKTVTLHVPRKSLRDSKYDVQQDINQYYANLLRLNSPKLGCNVFPILMPGYKAIPIRGMLNLSKQVNLNGLSLEDTTFSIDLLPAWATNIKVIQGTTLNGWYISQQSGDLAIFLDNLRNFLSRQTSASNEEQWLCYLCSPVQFQAEEDVQNRFWTRELTEWWSYSKVGGDLFSDFEYAFELPRDFLSPIARRARSWEGTWQVNPQLDLAVQLFAEVPTSPAYRTQIHAHRTHVIGQFLPWMCLKDEISTLSNMLGEVELVFRIVEFDNLIPPQDYVYGVIAEPMFNPMVGLFLQLENWEDFEKGTIRSKIESNNFKQSLIGKEGPSEIQHEVLSLFGDRFGIVPDQVIISQSDHIPGMPLNHVTGRTHVTKSDQEFVQGKQNPSQRAYEGF